MGSLFVYIAYRRPNQKIVEKLANDIRARGHDVFLDVWAIAPGHSIPERLNEGLERMSHFIYCFSSAGDSPWTIREWASTLHRKLSGERIEFLPVRVAGGDLPAILRDLKYVDAAADYDRALSELIKVIEH